MASTDEWSNLVADFDSNSSRSYRSPLTAALWQQPLRQKLYDRTSLTAATRTAATLTEAVWQNFSDSSHSDSSHSDRSPDSSSLTAVTLTEALWQQFSDNICDNNLTTTVTTTWQLLRQWLSKEFDMTMLGEKTSSSFYNAKYVLVTTLQANRVASPLQSRRQWTMVSVHVKTLLKGHHNI